MGEGIVIPIDGDDTRIRAKLARVKKEAAAVSKELNAAQVGSVAGRMGGAGGGMVGRALGGFSLGTGAGVAGIVATGAGVIMNRVFESSARAVENETGRLSLRRTLTHARQADDAARDSHARGVATSQLSNRQKLERFLSRGGNMDIAKTVAGKRSISNSDAIDLIGTAQDSGVGEDDLQRAMNTGEWGSYSEAAGDIKKYNGVRNALAMKRGLNSGDAYAMSEVDRQLNEGGGQIANVRKARAAGNKLEAAGYDAMTSGAAASAIAAEADKALSDPESAYDQAVKAAKDSADAQFAAALKQSRFVALFSGLFGSGTDARKALQEIKKVNGAQ